MRASREPFNLVTFAIVACGCDGPAPGLYALECDSYARGRPSCTEGTCQQANVTYGYDGAVFCTLQCTSDATCTPDQAGTRGVCVIGGGIGQCYAACPSRTDEECPSGETCSTTHTATPYCVP